MSAWEQVICRRGISACSASLKTLPLKIALIHLELRSHNRLSWSTANKPAGCGFGSGFSWSQWQLGFGPSAGYDYAENFSTLSLSYRHRLWPIGWHPCPGRKFCKSDFIKHPRSAHISSRRSPQLGANAGSSVSREWAAEWTGVGRL